jgi:hypothetical protein
MTPVALLAAILLAFATAASAQTTFLLFLSGLFIAGHKRGRLRVMI